jgi:hypothetical protein
MCVVGCGGDGYRSVQCAGVRGGGGGGHHPLPHPQPVQADLLARQHGQGGQEDHRPRAAQGTLTNAQSPKLTSNVDFSCIN